MKYILVLILVFFSFRVGFTNPKTNMYRQLIVVLPDSNIYNVSFVIWQNGNSKVVPMSEESKRDSLIYKIPTKNLPCVTSLEFRMLTGNKRSMSLEVVMSDKDLRISLPDWNSNPHWHGDHENIANENFVRNNFNQKQRLQILQNFISNYAERDELLNLALKTYKQQREEYNQWVSRQINKNENLWISHFWKNQFFTKAEITTDKEKNLHEVIEYTFEFEDFKDTTLLNSDYFLKLINNYMSMNEMLVQATKANRDSLMTKAGRELAQKASMGHPRLYGWVVDYLYTNYERYSIHMGIVMLQDHINNPNCLTYKKQEINRRLEGINRLMPGKTTALLQLENGAKEVVDVFNKTDKPLLLFFYESDCGHCEGLLERIKYWHTTTDASSQISICTISLDEDYNTWKKYHKEKDYEWKDLHAPGGINGKVAKDYVLLSTPTMIVLGKNNLIENVPKNIIDLFEFLYDEKEKEVYLNIIMKDD